MQDWEKHDRKRADNERLARAPWYVRLRWWWLFATVILSAAPVRFFALSHEAGLPVSPGGAYILPSESAVIDYMLLGTVILVPFAILTFIAFIQAKRATSQYQSVQESPPDDAEAR